MPQTNEQKRTSAKTRQAAYDALTPQQKLDRLDRAFGKDVGAKRERARLLKRMKMVGTVVPLSSVPAEIRDPRPTKEERRRPREFPKRIFGSLPPPGHEAEMGKTPAEILKMRKENKS